MARSRIGLVVLLLGCAERPSADGRGDSGNHGSPASGQRDAIVVAATAWPAAWLVEQIGGERVEWRARELLEEGVGIFGSPTPQQLLDLSSADRVFEMGGGYERWRETVSLPESRMVTLSRDLDLIEVEGRSHSHGQQGEHSHLEADPKTWLDVGLYRRQAERVAEALAEASPGDAALFDERLVKLDGQLEELSRELATAAEAAAPWSWASEKGLLRYLARSYDRPLRELAPNGAGSKDPSADRAHEMGHFADWARGQERVLFFWSREDPRGAFEALSPPILPVRFDPLEGPFGATGYDYIVQMRRNIERLTAAIPASH